MYCRGCIEKHLDNNVNNKSCPLCKCKIEKSTLCRSLFTEGFINDFDIRCKYYYKLSEIALDPSSLKRPLDKGYEVDPDGCKEIIKYGNMNHHQSQCQFAWVNCKYTSDGCTFTLTQRRKDINQHMEECIYRFISCKYCNNSIRFKDIETHNSGCLMIPVDCNMCNMVIPQRGQLQQHLDTECLEQFIECPFDSTLCIEMIKRKDKETHLKDQLVNHLVLQNRNFSNVVNQVTKENNNLSNEVKELKNRMEMQDKKLTEYKQIVQSMILNNHRGILIWTIYIVNFNNDYTYGYPFYVGERSFRVVFKRIVNSGSEIKFILQMTDLGTGSLKSRSTTFRVNITLGQINMNDYQLDVNYNPQNVEVFAPYYTSFKNNELEELKKKYPLVITIFGRQFHNDPTSI